MQVACSPPGPIVVHVEQYSLQQQQQGVDGSAAASGASLRLHLQSVGGSGGVKSLWVRSRGKASAASSAAQAALTADWGQLANVNGTAAWQLRWEPWRDALRWE